MDPVFFLLFCMYAIWYVFARRHYFHVVMRNNMAVRDNEPSMVHPLRLQFHNQWANVLAALTPVVGDILIVFNGCLDTDW